AKTNFIATVSHEFKTPISSMKMSLQLLEKETIGKLNKEQKNLIESMKEDTNRLLRTTSELLNITQVETGQSKLNIRKTNLKDCIIDALKSNEKLALEKNIQLDFKLEASDIKIAIDPEKTTWIISNLLSNAIRYSYENSTVTISLLEKQNEIEIKVKDNGKGIDKQYQSKIFDRYFRVPGSKYDGTGLGLAISKEFIQELGGSISFKSELGTGSEFKITFTKA
ncbi:HAMP domain-containing sensor histidine kinase, partial [Flavobacterium sp.]|uniref:sensor histidine kinase n=1 Tax=Flavobacterium sp. TaxID=239 RepID=UPI0025BEC1F9